MGLYVGKTILWYNTMAVRRHLSDNDLILMTVTPLSTNESSRLPVKQRNISSRLLWVVIPDLLRDTIYRRGETTYWYCEKNCVCQHYGED